MFPPVTSVSLLDPVPLLFLAAHRESFSSYLPHTRIGADWTTWDTPPPRWCEQPSGRMCRRTQKRRIRWDLSMRGWGSITSILRLTSRRLEQQRGHGRTAGGINEPDTWMTMTMTMTMTMVMIMMPVVMIMIIMRLYAIGCTHHPMHSLSDTLVPCRIAAYARQQGFANVTSATAEQVITTAHRANISRRRKCKHPHS